MNTIFTNHKLSYQQEALARTYLSEQARVRPQHSVSISIVGDAGSGKTSCALALCKCPFMELPPSEGRCSVISSNQMLGRHSVNFVVTEGEYLLCSAVILLVNATSPEGSRMYERYSGVFHESQIVYILITKCDLATANQFFQAVKLALHFQEVLGQSNPVQVVPICLCEGKVSKQTLDEILVVSFLSHRHVQAFQELVKQQKAFQAQIQKRFPSFAGEIQAVFHEHDLFYDRETARQIASTYKQFAPVQFKNVGLKYEIKQVEDAPKPAETPTYPREPQTPRRQLTATSGAPLKVPIPEFGPTLIPAKLPKQIAPAILQPAPPPKQAPARDTNGNAPESRRKRHRKPGEALTREDELAEEQELMRQKEIANELLAAQFSKQQPTTIQQGVAAKLKNEPKAQGLARVVVPVVKQQAQAALTNKRSAPAEPRAKPQTEATQARASQKAAQPKLETDLLELFSLADVQPNKSESVRSETLDLVQLSANALDSHMKSLKEEDEDRRVLTQSKSSSAVLSGGQAAPSLMELLEVPVAKKAPAGTPKRVIVPGNGAVSTTSLAEQHLRLSSAESIKLTAGSNILGFQNNTNSIRDAVLALEAAALGLQRVSLSELAIVGSEKLGSGLGAFCQQIGVKFLLPGASEDMRRFQKVLFVKNGGVAKPDNAALITFSRQPSEGDLVVPCNADNPAAMRLVFKLLLRLRALSAGETVAEPLVLSPQDFVIPQ